MAVMQTRKKSLIILGLIVLSLFVHFAFNNSFFVETAYSTGFYPHLARLLRFFFGWLPFSIGDILYGVIAVCLVVKVVKAVIKIFKKEMNWAWMKCGAYKMVVWILFIYIIFNVLWGINYNRLGIAYQLGLDTKRYTAKDLAAVDSLLLQKVNENKSTLIQIHQTEINKKEIFKRSDEAYKNAAIQFPFLTYQTNAVKSSLWGWLGNYLGFMGYYDPFTGEAQVNTTVPYFLQPYTTCHEMAHQVGYAREDEANFVGYLAAAASSDTLFHYSVYLDLFLTTNRNLYIVDSVAAKSFAKQLSPAVKEDIKQWRTFAEAHQNPVEPIIRWMYGKYLQSNKQPAGNLTYDEVTGLLVAYYKKYGKL
ncbi:DUF3810 domain-containing protein [Ferruginibacter albus]|uniref:DUF3810 domain-containing protein n=1 Tax=Ferruginibacter albus TaxID=2875540 RepID=UPI001CC629B3|nr:DUF3810 domain-containing protein [Ferruginibacter albus]UAY51341.1 DUF3810 domain-containing protein [Ferruginibacter albus]